MKDEYLCHQFLYSLNNLRLKEIMINQIKIYTANIKNITTNDIKHKQIVILN